ncbi:MAG: methylenetetrahydrofolate reductase C-terminal domain-containing protein [Candidatus Hydrothermarchaeales archaeon]
MIVSEEKALKDILEILTPYTDVAIVGCSGCYGVGMLKNVERLADKLEAAGKRIVAKGATGRQCSWFWKPVEVGLDLVAQNTKGIEAGELEKAEAILSLACGVGVQTLAKAADSKFVVPATDTKFMGRREEAMFYEQCMACGNCILHSTGGICPVTRCPKAHMNGPCGGVYNGKCEVNRENDCAWVLIYDRLSSMGKVELMKDKKSPKDFSLRTHPRRTEAEA